MATRLAGSTASQTRFALSSLWRWPSITPLRRALLLAWVLAVQWLPLPLARRVARLHRQLVGAPTG
jgi:hypothetical protein